MKKDDVLKSSSFLVFITAIVSILNFIYNALMSRMLKISDFGDLRALFSVVMIIAIPVSVVQTTIAKFTAELYKIHLGKLKLLIMHTLSFIFILGFILIVIFTVFRYQIYNYLKVSSVSLIICLGPVLLVMLIQPVILGIFQGLQRFILLGINNLISTILKLLLGIFFVYLGYATLGALYGLIFSGVLVILTFGLILISSFRKGRTIKDVYNKQDIYSYSGYALGILICFSVLSQIDIIIVKHKFLPSEAGLYACAAVIGKGFLFLPVPIVTILFPKVVENNKRGRSNLFILMQSLFFSLILCLVGIIICFFFPHFLVKIFGSKYAQATYLIKIFGLSMSPFALFYVVINYFLSKYRLSFFYYCLLVCILEIFILFFWPKTLEQFLIVLGWFGLSIFIVPLFYMLINEHKIAYRIK
jgi:O-antigen/teichoic acid export membrane protein